MNPGCAKPEVGNPVESGQMQRHNQKTIRRDEEECAQSETQEQFENGTPAKRFFGAA